MAGHRKAKGRPVRQPSGARARSRLASAATAETQLAAAYDLFRVAARGRSGLMREAAQCLLGLINGGSHGHGE
jgi:hypothetical protein